MVDVVFSESGTEYELQYLEKVGGENYRFPDKDEYSTEEEKNIIRKLPQPTITGSSTRTVFAFPKIVFYVE